MEMYEEVRLVVQLEGHTSEDFPVKVGVHQGSILSPWFFNIVLDEVSKEARENGMKELLYADDLALIGKTKQELEMRYMKQKRALQVRGGTQSES